MSEIMERPAESTALVTIETMTPAVLFREGGVEDVLSSLETAVRAMPRDISTPKGRAAVKSTALKIARSKTAMDGMGKQLTDEIRKQAESIHAGRRDIVSRCDALRAWWESPLKAWEAEEAEEIAANEAALAEISQAQSYIGQSSEVISDRLSYLRNMPARTWRREFRQREEDAVAGEIAAMERMLADAQARERAEAEADRLRQEAEARAERERQAAAEAVRLEAERQQREREARIAAEAAQRARDEAERAAVELRAREEQERAQVEARRVAAERAEATRVEAERQAERNAAAARERKAEADRLRAEQDRIAAEQRAQRQQEQAKAASEEARLAAIRAAEQAEFDRQAAVQAERQRAADEAAAARAEAERRAANKAHKAKINNAAMAALVTTGLPEEYARAAIVAIASGQVPHVSIGY